MMVEFFREWIINIVTVMVIIVIVEIMVPSGKTRKIINLVSGFIILAVIISPIARIIGKGVSQKDFGIIDMGFLERQEIKQNSSMLEEKQIEQIINVYRNKLAGQIEDAVKEMDNTVEVNADVIVNENYESVYLGEVKKVFLDIWTGAKGNEIRHAEIKPIDDVDIIDKIDIRNPNEDKKESENTSNKQVITEDSKGIEWEYRDDAAEKISRLFNVDRQDIKISIRGSRGQ
jgi:stage III sporulation protein AF